MLDNECKIPNVYMKHISFYTTIHQNQSFAQQAYFHFRPSSLQEKSRLITSYICKIVEKSFLRFFLDLKAKVSVKYLRYGQFLNSLIVPLICTLFLVLKRWMLLPPWKNRVEFNLNFFRVTNWKKAGFHKVNQKKNRCLPRKESGWLLLYIFSSSWPRKSQMTPSKSIFRVQIKGATDFDLILTILMRTTKVIFVCGYQRLYLSFILLCDISDMIYS